MTLAEWSKNNEACLKRAGFNGTDSKNYSVIIERRLEPLLSNPLLFWHSGIREPELTPEMIWLDRPDCEECQKFLQKLNAEQKREYSNLVTLFEVTHQIPSEMLFDFAKNVDYTELEKTKMVRNYRRAIEKLNERNDLPVEDKLDYKRKKENKIEDEHKKEEHRLEKYFCVDKKGLFSGITPDEGKLYLLLLTNFGRHNTSIKTIQDDRWEEVQYQTRKEIYECLFSMSKTEKWAYLKKTWLLTTIKLEDPIRYRQIKAWLELSSFLGFYVEKDRFYIETAEDNNYETIHDYYGTEKYKKIFETRKEKTDALIEALNWLIINDEIYFEYYEEAEASEKVIDTIIRNYMTEKMKRKKKEEIS